MKFSEMCAAHSTQAPYGLGFHSTRNSPYRGSAAGDRSPQVREIITYVPAPVPDPAKKLTIESAGTGEKVTVR
jgi:hypothetical protein